jgi:beta-lactamase regulating signal transducer with metallopeptidase domain
MLVEALFWFHPLVWWVGAKMVEERERACDEQVLELGSERHVYAESILRVCEFCAAYPVPCVSRVTGADLKKRIVHIMSRNAAARKLELSTKALLGTSAGLVILAPVLFGMINGTPQRVETPSHQLRSKRNRRCRRLASHSCVAKDCTSGAGRIGRSISESSY